MLKVKELKLYNICREKIDNGYMVSPTYRYSSDRAEIVVDMDKINDYGTKAFVLSIDDKLMTNYKNKTMKWDSVESVEKDIIDIFNGKMPTRFYTTCY